MSAGPAAAATKCTERWIESEAFERSNVLRLVLRTQPSRNHMLRGSVIIVFALTQRTGRLPLSESVVGLRAVGERPRIVKREVGQDGTQQLERASGDSGALDLKNTPLALPRQAGPARSNVDLDCKPRRLCRGYGVGDDIKRVQPDVGRGVGWGEGVKQFLIIEHDVALIAE